MKYVSVLSGILITFVRLFAMEEQIESKQNSVVLVSSDKIACKININIAKQFPYLENAFSNGMQESINQRLQTELQKEELEVLVHYLTLIGNAKIANEQEIIQSSKENRTPSLKNIKTIILDALKSSTHEITQYGPCLFGYADQWLIDDLSHPLISYFCYLILNHEEVNFEDNFSDSLSNGFDALQKRNLPKLATNETFQRYLPLIPELTNPLARSMQEQFLGFIPFETEQQLTQKSSVCVDLNYDNQSNKLIITDPHTITILGEQKQSKFDTTISTISTVKKAIYNPHTQQIYAGTQQGMIKPFNLTNYRFGDSITTSEKKAVLALALHHQKNVLVSGGNNTTIRCHNPISNKLIHSYKICHSPIYVMNFVNNDLVFGSEHNCGFLDIEHEQEPKRYFRPIKERNQSNYSVKAIAPYDNNTFVFNSGNGLILFDTRCVQDSLKLKGHTRTILSVVTLPNCQKVISGGYDHKARIWDLRTQRCLRTIANNSPITCMTFDDNKKELFIGDFNGVVKKYGLSTDPIRLLDFYKKTLIQTNNKNETANN